MAAAFKKYRKTEEWAQRCTDLRSQLPTHEVAFQLSVDDKQLAGLGDEINDLAMRYGADIHLESKPGAGTSAITFSGTLGAKRSLVQVLKSFVRKHKLELKVGGGQIIPAGERVVTYLLM